VKALEQRLVPVVGLGIPVPTIESPFYRNDPYPAIVEIRDNSDLAFGTGALLFTGQDILTAAHVVCNDGTAQVKNTRFEVDFWGLLSQPQYGQYLAFYVTPADVHIAPHYDGNLNNGNDFAIIHLSQRIPSSVVPGYDLYDQKDELNQQFGFYGYGLTGVLNSPTDTVTRANDGWTSEDFRYGDNVPVHDLN
jgi:hypothetical protein